MIFVVYLPGKIQTYERNQILASPDDPQPKHQRTNYDLAPN
jgi:hypothetical protein